MLRELLDFLTNDEPLDQARQDLEVMLSEALRMVDDAGRIFDEGRASTEAELEDLRARDVKVNQHERSIRKLLVAHIVSESRIDSAYALVLMSVVKDVERLGDYAKNLGEISGMGSVTGSKLERTVLERGAAIRALGHEAKRVLFQDDEPDLVRARALALEARDHARECDKLVADLAESSESAGPAIRLALAVRFHKRIACHTKNLLTSVLMPVHKVDYLDDEWLERAAAAE